MTQKYDGQMIERRFSTNVSIPQEENTTDDSVGILEGVPIVFNQETVLRDIFGNEMVEVILPTAIEPTAITRDCALFYNHDESKKPLARVRTGRLTLTTESDGIHMRAELNLDRQDCKDLYLAVKDGEIDKMSFAFRMDDFEMDYSGDIPKRTITNISYIREVCKDLYLAVKDGEIDKMSFAFRMDDFEMDYSGDIPKRTITNISYIREVSAVSDPAYQQTSIKARSADSVETESDTVEMVHKAFMEYKDKERKEALALAKAKAKAYIATE